ncbi:MAG: hypothetical protein ACKOW9_02520 [Candidatus Paceibacterota bacterium]
MEFQVIALDIVGACRRLSLLESAQREASQYHYRDTHLGNGRRRTIAPVNPQQLQVSGTVQVPQRLRALHVSNVLVLDQSN